MKKVLSQADSGKDSHHRMKRIAQKKHRRNQNLKRIWISLLILASYGAWQSNLSISSACAIQSQLVVIQLFKVVLAVVFYLQPPNAFLTSEIGEVNGLFPFAFLAPGVEMALHVCVHTSYHIVADRTSYVSHRQPLYFKGRPRYFIFDLLGQVRITSCHSLLNNHIRHLHPSWSF